MIIGITAKYCALFYFKGLLFIYGIVIVTPVSETDVKAIVNGELMSLL